MAICRARPVHGQLARRGAAFRGDGWLAHAPACTSHIRTRATHARPRPQAPGGGRRQSWKLCAALARPPGARSGNLDAHVSPAAIAARRGAAARALGDEGGAGRLEGQVTGPFGGWGLAERACCHDLTRARAAAQWVSRAWAIERT